MFAFQVQILIITFCKITKNKVRARCSGQKNCTKKLYELYKEYESGLSELSLKFNIILKNIYLVIKTIEYEDNSSGLYIRVTNSKKQ